MVEFVFSIPLLVLLVGAIFFFGFYMRNRLGTWSSSRWAADQRVEHLQSFGPESTGLDELNLYFFNEEAGTLEVEGHGDVHDLYETFIEKADQRSPEAGDTAEEFIDRAPHGKRTRVFSDVPADSGLFNRIANDGVWGRHINPGLPWRRSQAAMTATVIELYLRDFDDTLEAAKATGRSEMLEMIQNLYDNPWSW
jgi:hypothetical protein